MSERKMKLRLGVFVLLALGLLILMVIMFGSAPAIFKRTHEYRVRFTDAPGVSEGTPVRRSGVRIGQVSEVRLDDETGNVVVTLAIERKYTVRMNEVPTLITRLIGGDANIDFIPVKPEDPAEEVDRSPIPPGTELAGVVRLDVGELLTKATEVVPTTQETMNEIRKSMKRLEEMSPLVEETLKETRDLARVTREGVPDARRAFNEVGELARAVRDTVPEFRRTNAEVQEFARAVKEAVPELRQTNKEVQEFARAAREAVPDFRRTADEVRELSKAVKESVPELRQTNKEIQDLAKAAREAVPEFRQTNQELQTLIKSANETVPNVRRAIEDVAASARSINRLAERVDLLVQTNQDKISAAIDRLNDVLTQVSSVLSEQNVKNATAILQNTRDASDRFPNIATNLDELLREGRGSLKRIDGSLSRAETFMESIEKVTQPLGERGPTIVRNLDEGLATLNKTLGDVRELVRAIGSADGTVNKLLTDASLYNRIDNTIAMVGQIIPRLDRILKDVEIFADKIARHPESLGVGGVVRPGSGLKNPSPVDGKIVPPLDGKVIQPLDGQTIPPTFYPH